MYDLIIIGLGPAGLTSSIYASRFRIKHLLIGSSLGGAMALAFSVENYPGFEKISGLELAKKMESQAKNLGAEILVDEVVKIKGGPSFTVETASGRKFQAKNLIVATGTKRRQLGIPGETEYLGRGVSYCSTCDAPFFKDKVVAVIGGSNAAAMGAVHLSSFAKKVYLLYRGKPLRAEPAWVEKVEKTPRITVIYETNIKKILGYKDIKILSEEEKAPSIDRVAAVELDKPYKGKRLLPVDGVFVEIGGVPGAELVKPLGVELNEKGFIKVGADMATNIAGIFAAGDVANASGELQQIVTAVSEGAIAAASVYQNLGLDKDIKCTL
ncbi:MAG: NAD(P)/FAD-dependent oxidoreductase [Patescibacteria group bacterium]